MKKITIYLAAFSFAVFLFLMTTRFGFIAKMQSVTNDNESSALFVCITPPANMVAWYPGDGNANDITTGNNSNGVIQGDVTFAPGVVGQAFNFNGNGYVIANSPSLNAGTGNGLTIDAWINPTSVDTQRPLVEWNNGTNSSGIGAHFWISVSTLGSTPRNLFANLVDTSGANHIIQTTGGLITANNYQHVAITYDKASGVANLYLNGAVVATQNLGTFTPQTSYPLYLANRPAPPHPLYTGTLDEISIYNRSLAQSEIQSIFNAGSAGKCRPTAASVSIGGRVMSGKGHGISRARVYITSVNGETRTALTNSFGYYRFADIPAGGTYIFSVTHKRYTFAPQVLTITEEINDLNFTAEP